jgi:trehalose 2-sulfotransferase
MTPRRSYLVCATPRSGTGLLGGLLRSTGVAGRPEEYFWRDGRPVWEPGVIDHGTTPNGVFGATVMWGYFGGLLGALAAAGTGLASVLPGLRFIWLRRDDTVAQAVSHLRALQTGVWYAGDPRNAGGEPRFDLATLDHLVAEIAEHNHSWQEWFAEQGATPLCLTYELVAKEPTTAARMVLDFLDLRTDVPLEVQTEQQADEVNAEWVTRYRTLRC